MKCVIIVEESLTPGTAANACAILALSFGRSHPELVGPDVTDGEGKLHAGITTIPLPVLKAPAGDIESIRRRLGGEEGVYQADFTEIARSSADYGSYAEKLGGTSAPFEYLALLAYGPRKTINSITGSLPLFR